MAYASTNIHGTKAEARGFFAALRSRMEKRRIYRNTFNELAALSDRELDDLGLHRTMIQGVAYHAAYSI
ncbi:MAG: putative conserved small protein [Rhodobacteraceae bacterium HLUCCA08]|nr:MAG: putative conserved small protein [Rhodobacteraceae bacterium HLUCCA08]